MRKYWNLVAILALCLFTVFAIAQTPGGTTGTNDNSSNSAGSATSNPQNSSQPVTGSSTDPYSVKSGANGRAADSGASDSTSAGAEKTLDGCIVKEQTDYFIQPASGDAERLIGSDVSAHAGHHVKVHGSEAAGSGSSASNSSASSSERTATSGSASTEAQNNSAGSMAGNAGSSNASGNSGFASGDKWTGKNFSVTKVDMVSESCPADIQSKIDQHKSK